MSNIVAGRDRDIPRKRVIVDAEDYRRRREDTLVRLANRMATKAKKSWRRVVLDPMNPQERRVIHTTLEKDPDVKSISEGEDPYRRLVIYPVGGESRSDRGGRYSRSGRGSDRGSGSYERSGNRGDSGTPSYGGSTYGSSSYRNSSYGSSPYGNSSYGNSSYGNTASDVDEEDDGGDDE